MTDGFHIAMVACAGLAALGGILAWLTISSDVLETEVEPTSAAPERPAGEYTCGVSGAPLRPGREADGEPVAAPEVAATGAR